MLETWDEELYPLPKDSPCRACLCGNCSPDYYKRCTVWKSWFAERWDVIQTAAAKSKRQEWG